MIRHGLVYGGVTAATFTAITAVTGLGWGWIPNLSVPVSLRSLLSPPTFLGSAVEWLLTLAGMPESVDLSARARSRRRSACSPGLAAIAWITWRFAPAQPGARHRGRPARALRLGPGHPPVVPPLGRAAPRRRAPLGEARARRRLRDALLRHLRRRRRDGLQRHVGARRLGRAVDGGAAARQPPSRARAGPASPCSPPPSPTADGQANARPSTGAGQPRRAALRAIPSRMSCSDVTTSVTPARSTTRSTTRRQTSAPAPMTSTRPGCM